MKCVRSHAKADQRVSLDDPVDRTELDHISTSTSSFRIPSAYCHTSTSTITLTITYYYVFGHTWNWIYANTNIQRITYTVLHLQLLIYFTRGDQRGVCLEATASYYYVFASSWDEAKLWNISSFSEFLRIQFYKNSTSNFDSV